MSSKIKVGEKGPNFTLPDTAMKPRSLKEFWGRKIVLAFFVGAFMSSCTKEMCEFRDSMAHLIELNAQVIGISVNDPFINKAFAEKNMLPFPLLSDYKREIIKTSGLELPKKGAEVHGLECIECGEIGHRPQMLRQEIEETREVAAIARERMRRGATLAAEPALPIRDGGREIGSGREARERGQDGRSSHPAMTTARLLARKPRSSVP